MFAIFRRRHGNAAFWLLVAATIFQLAFIAHSISRPMWFDESWRADFVNRNLDIPLVDRSTYAPISAGLFVFTKATTAFVDNNFTHRLSTYIAALAVPFVVYWFCRVFFDRRMALVMIPVTVLAGYNLEFATQNKPYMLDVVCTLLLLLAYHYYVHKKLRLRYFILGCVGALLFSFAAFFVVTVIGLLMVHRWYKNPNKTDVRSLIIWAGSVGAAALAHLWFIWPQLNEGLDTYWGDLYLQGGLGNILIDTGRNLLSIFGLTIGEPLLSRGLEDFSVLWTNLEFPASSWTVLGLPEFLAIVWLSLFVYGVYALWHAKKHYIPVVLMLLWGLQWVTSITGHWPFGNARTNLFSNFLVLLIVVYGSVEAWRHTARQYAVVSAALLLTIVLLAFPYRTLAIAFFSTKDTAFVGDNGINSGLQWAAVTVAQQSQADDEIIVSHSAGPFGFEYYYNFSDYTADYRATQAKKVTYGYQKNNRLPLHATLDRKPDVVWLIGPDMDKDVVAEYFGPFEAVGYRMTNLGKQPDVSVIKLTKVD